MRTASSSVVTEPYLSPRLAAVAALVPPGLPVADIGTDHARLPASLVATGRVPFAVGIDDKDAPLAVARALVTRLALVDRVVLRKSSGCAGLSPHEVHTVTICGMGGPTMERILAGVPAGVGRLVLQPNTGEAGLRAWLPAHGWDIDVEHLVEDRGRWFVVIGATLASLPPGAGGQAPPQRPPRDAGASPSDPVSLAYGDMAVHRDMATLAARLDTDAARIDALLAAHDGPRADAALAAQRDVIAEARARLRRLTGR